MSRVANNPVSLPKGVELNVNGREVMVKGAKGSLSLSLHEGIVMTQTDLLKVFASNGIEKFGEIGDTFDPGRYDAMFQYEDDSKEAGSVGQVIMQGYSFKDRALRPCQVGVVKEA